MTIVMSDEIKKVVKFYVPTYPVFAGLIMILLYIAFTNLYIN